MESLGNLRGRTFAVGLILGLVLYGLYYGCCFQYLYTLSDKLMGYSEQEFTVAIPGGAQKGSQEHLTFTLRLAYPRYLVAFGTQEVWMLITREAPSGRAASNESVPLRISLKAQVEGQSEEQGSIPWVACSVPTSGNRCPEGKQALEFDLAPGEQTVGVWYVVLLKPWTEGKDLRLKPQVLRRTEQGWKHMEVNKRKQTNGSSDGASEEGVVIPAQGIGRVKVLCAMLIKAILLPPWSNVFLLTLTYIAARVWSRYWRWCGIQGPQYEEERKQREKEQRRRDEYENMHEVLRDLSHQLQQLQGLAAIEQALRQERRSFRALVRAGHRYAEHLHDALNDLSTPLADLKNLSIRLAEMNNDLSAELSNLVKAVNALRKDDGEAGTAPTAETSPSGEPPSPKDEDGENPSPPTGAPSPQAPSQEEKPAKA